MSDDTALRIFFLIVIIAMIVGGVWLVKWAWIHAPF